MGGAKGRSERYNEDEIIFIEKNIFNLRHKKLYLIHLTFYVITLCVFEQWVGLKGDQNGIMETK